jgi:hypothetical protein
MANQMLASNPGRITINTGTFTTDTCTMEYDLIRNQQKRPVIREMMEYAQRRALTTLITSGAVTPYGIKNTERTKLNEVSTKGTAIASNGYQFPVMGRIETASTIIKQIGTTQADGTFQLLMRDRQLVNGMNVVFYSRTVAMVLGNPTGNVNTGFTYTFRTPSGDLFVFATDVAPQSGTKTCMGMYTSYGEKSLRGDSRTKFSDMFINHTTIQRKTCGWSGTVGSQVLWVTYTNSEGGVTKGFVPQEIAQSRATFVMENERQKLFGVSTMKNADGSAKMVAPIDEIGNPLIAGDGWEEQVAGGNVATGSGINGEALVSDFADMMSKLEQNSDQINGCSFLAITGTYGYANAQTQMATLGQVQGVRTNTDVPADDRVGGPKVNIGYEFSSFNVNGNRMIFVKHPLFDDRLMWTKNGNDGNPLMSSTYFIMDMNSEGGQKTMEILYKSANGMDRSMVEAKYNGLTGDSELSLSEEDAGKYAMLKEDMLVVYNTQKCGIIRKVF